MEGENTLSIHGLAMMSPWPMTNVHAVDLPNGKDKMWGKEKRLGWLAAMIADIEHPAGIFRAVGTSGRSLLTRASPQADASSSSIT